MMPYYEGRCFLKSDLGVVAQFANERELEAFVARCQHPRFLQGADGYLYCTTCWAMPNLRGARHGLN